MDDDNDYFWREKNHEHFAGLNVGKANFQQQKDWVLGQINEDETFQLEWW